MARPKIVDKVAARMIRELAAGSWEPGQRLPPSRAMAAEYNIAQATMQAALRDLASHRLLAVRPRQPTVILPGAIERARRLATRFSARSARRRVGILISEEIFPLPRHSYYAWLVGLIAKEAGRRKIGVKVMEWPLRDQVGTVQSFLHREYGAALLIGVSPAYLVSLTVLHEHHFPVVLFNRRFPGLDLPTVRTDVYGAMQRVTDHLIAFGHRRIRLVTHHHPQVIQSQFEWTRDWIRYLGEKKVLESSAPPVWFVPRGEPESFLRQLLEGSRRPTAVIFSTEGLAKRLLYREPYEAIKVPGDLSVAIFGSADSIPQAPRHPLLTTITEDVPRIAQCLVEIVDKQLRGEEAPPSIRVPLKVNLTESIGRAPEDSAG